MTGPGADRAATAVHGAFRAVFGAALLLLCIAPLTLSPAARASETALELQRAYPIPAVLSLPALPETTSRSPAVLLLHGTASHKDEVGNLFARLARRLADHGIASLRIDFAGCGESPVGHERFTLSSTVADARTALDFLRTHESVDGDRIAVLGFSQGGLIAQRLVLAEPSVAALATWSTVAVDGIGSFQPFFDRHHDTARQEGAALVSFGWLAAPVAFSAKWFEEIAAHTTLSEMAAYPGPRLAIAGLADETVPYSQSVALIEQSAHPQSRALLIAGADHIFNVLSPEDGESPDGTRSVQLLAETVSWLQSQLSAAQQSPAPAG